MLWKLFLGQNLVSPEKKPHQKSFFLAGNRLTKIGNFVHYFLKENAKKACTAHSNAVFSKSFSF